MVEIQASARQDPWSMLCVQDGLPIEEPSCIATVPHLVSADGYSNGSGVTSSIILPRLSCTKDADRPKSVPVAFPAAAHRVDKPNEQDKSPEKKNPTLWERGGRRHRPILSIARIIHLSSNNQSPMPSCQSRPRPTIIQPLSTQ
jgi:hypothetical protein